MPYTANVNSVGLQRCQTKRYNHNAVFSTAWAAGGILANAEDNVQFWSWLISGQIISSASLDEMRRYITLSPTRAYGLGIFRLKNINGRDAFSHGGTNIGFINENMMDSVNGTTISALTNQDSVGNSIVMQLVAALHRETLKNQTLGVSRAGGAAISVHPYPSRDYLMVEAAPDQRFMIRLSDMTGKVLYSAPLIGRLRIDVRDYASGFYTVRLTDERGQPSGARTVVIQ